MTAQQGLWHDANHPNTKGVQKVTPPPSERQSIGNLLMKGQPPWTCEQNDWPDLLNQLAYTSAPVSAATRVLLVEAGPGCARGGQGSNGAMWLIASDGRNPILLAGPQQDFQGFLYSIEPTSAKGYRDIVLGWHGGGRETGLVYSRFDGTFYRSIGSANLSSDKNGIPKITPSVAPDPFSKLGR